MLSERRNPAQDTLNITLTKQKLLSIMPSCNQATGCSPQPYRVTWSCLFDTLCYVKATLGWPGCGWLVSHWINNANPPSETSRYMTYSSTLLQGSSVSSVWSVTLTLWFSVIHDHTVNTVCVLHIYLSYIFLYLKWTSTHWNYSMVNLHNCIPLISPKFNLVLRETRAHSGFVQRHLTVSCACWTAASINCFSFCFNTSSPWLGLVITFKQSFGL